MRVAIVGLGNVGRRLLELIELKRELLRTRFDVELTIVAAADRSGGAVSSGGLNIAEVLRLKRERKGVAAYSQFGKPGLTPQELASESKADVLVELSLTNMKDGEPGLSTIRQALAQKMHVVTANKGPLVRAFPELQSTAQANGVRLLFSATVTGGLPTLNIGVRDLGTAIIEKFQGVINGTSNYILSRMAQGQTYEEALAQAQAIGMTEADPLLDVDGWDAANKLVIIANAVLNCPKTLQEVSVEGIRRVTQDDLRGAERRGQTIKLVALAERTGNDYRLSVRPTALAHAHPLARLSGGMMGVMYHTDINGVVGAFIEEEDPYPTAAAVLRDIVEITIHK